MLNNSDYAIAVNSTVLFEATVYPELKILIYQKEDIEPILPLIELGYTETFSNEEELKLYLSMNNDKQEGNANNYFYMQNTANNTR